MLQVSVFQLQRFPECVLGMGMALDPSQVRATPRCENMRRSLVWRLDVEAAENEAEGTWQWPRQVQVSRHSLAITAE